MKLYIIICLLIVLNSSEPIAQENYCGYVHGLERDFYNEGGCRVGDFIYYALIPPLEKASGLKASCSVDGMHYLYEDDSLFLADIYKWKKHFNCDYKLDTLTICEKLHLLALNRNNAINYVPQFQKRSGLKAHPKFLYLGGYWYENDSIFQADIKQWKDYFKCDSIKK